MRSLIHRLASWIAAKSMPSSLGGGQWSGTGFSDRYKRNRSPTPNELMEELKGIAWSCASINASVCAAYPPTLYVTTTGGQARPRCATRAVSHKTNERLRSAPHLVVRTRGAVRIEEVTDHPLLDLLRMPTPSDVSFNAFDLWELTTLYLEVHGLAYWHVPPGPFGSPTEIWLMPTQNMWPMRKTGSSRIVDYYSYKVLGQEQRFDPEEIVAFRYPDPRNPYTGGLSPLRAAWEQVSLTSHYSARKESIFQNDAIPAALISPDDVVGEEERDRLEGQWNAKLRKGGAGKVIVAESNMKVQLLQHSLGDLALLADLKASKEDIANAFHIPLSYLTSQTNLANLQAARTQHMSLAIEPRITRRDEKLNEQLVPLFDASGRLFLASEDPVPSDQDAGVQQMTADLKYGVISINEERAGRGLPPVSWGNTPWLPLIWAPTDAEARSNQKQKAPNIQGSNPKDEQ